MSAIELGITLKEFPLGVGDCVLRVHDASMLVNGQRRAFWLYETEGFTEFNQSDLMLLVLRHHDEPAHPFPDRVVGFFAVVADLAASGRIVGENAFTKFGAPGFLAPDDGIDGVYYRAAPAVAGLVSPMERLVVLPVFRDEMACLHKFGHGRMLSLLGKQAAYFPYPPWHDRGRGCSLDGPRYRDGSILGRMKGIALPGVHLVLHHKTLTLMVSTAAKDRIDAAIAGMEENTAHALLTGPKSEMDANFTWEPGQDEPFAIVFGPTDGVELEERRVGANFLTVAHGRDARQSTMVEDGFLVEMTDQDWAGFTDALRAQEAFEMPAPGGFVEVFRLAFFDPVYHSPFGGDFAKSFTITLDPKSVDAASAKLMRLAQVVARCSENELLMRVASPAFAKFVRDVGASFDGFVPRFPEEFEAVVVGVTLSPARGLFQAKTELDLEIMFVGGTEGDILREFEDALEKLKRPKVHGPVAVDLIFARPCAMV